MLTEEDKRKKVAEQLQLYGCVEASPYWNRGCDVGDALRRYKYRRLALACEDILGGRWAGYDPDVALDLNGQRVRIVLAVAEAIVAAMERERGRKFVLDPMTLQGAWEV